MDTVCHATCMRCQMDTRFVLETSAPPSLNPMMCQAIASDLGCPRQKQGRLCGTIKIDVINKLRDAA